ncbi:MAG: class I SAM-dependent methyltransferase [Chitinophagaceae bacterium]|nr:class I SAM-dependent methyltransferase [Chitinophagaceae bacterium]
MENKYIHTSDAHNLVAPGVIVPYLIKIFAPRSVADIGCGLGTFLYVFKQHGVTDIVGVDGSWVKKEQMFISEVEFIEADLEKELQVDRKFDLVLCLEVAEHLREESADIIVKNLISLSNTIVFSAAVPNQGGQNHLNEQEYSYWQSKFAKYGYIFYDIFREQFWNNREINWWYKQNMFLVAHETVSFPEEILKRKVIGQPIVYIHPGNLAERVSQIDTVINQAEGFLDGNVSLAIYFIAIKNKFVKSMKKILGLKKSKR